MKQDLKSMTLAEMQDAFAAIGEPKFRAKQVFTWLHRGAVSFDAMTNLSKPLREKLDGLYYITAPSVARKQVSKLDGTIKLLYRLPDGNVIEGVLMRYKYGNTVCVSTQVGCAMGCRFCASTLDGLARNLYPSEMLDQIYRIQSLTGNRVSNVVVMGSGEPFDNFDNFIKFEKLLTDENGLNISARNLTVSTCGLVPRIYELADMRLQITLAISLHSPTDEMRKKLMPVANKYSISEIMDACSYYIEKTGRRITFEYSLVKGENDGSEHALILADLVKGMNCHINLIPVNPIKERDYRQSDTKSIKKFKDILEKNRIQVTVRREMGRDIDGACGQLRKRYMDDNAAKI